MTPGRIVHFVLPNGECRPAMVLGKPSPDDPNALTMMLFLDWKRDQAMYPFINGAPITNTSYCPILYVADVPYHEPVSGEVVFNTWHWPERE